jgi:hypothetical protein
MYPLYLALLLSLTSALSASTVIHTEPIADGLLVHIEFDEYQLSQQPGSEFTEILLEGAFPLGQPGQPSLPHLSRLIDMPDRSAAHIEILNQRWTIESGIIAPEQERVLQAEDFPAPFVQDTRLYATNANFPANSVELGAPALLRNNRICQLSIIPVRCNPIQEQIELLQEMDLRITFNGEDSRNQKTFELPESASFWNDMIETERLVPTPQAERDMYELRDTPGTYIVVARNTTITNDPYFLNWLNWKREKGHLVFVATEAIIGGWDPSDIKEYLEDAYTTWDTPPDYIMLIGDPSGSSSFHLPINSSSYSGTYDHFYATLDGSDYFADVAVGRISVENSSQMQGVFYKEMLYETTPQLAGTNWMRSAALATGWNAISMIQQSRTIVSDMAEDGITSVDTLWYPNSDAGDVNNWFNDGICLYNYRGWIGMDGLSTSFIDNSSNFTNDGMPAVAAIYTCSTGSFEGYSQTEALLRKGDIAHPRGAVATMGFATSNTHTAYNNAICGGFWSAFLDHGLVQIGPAMFYGKLTLASTLPPGDSNAEHFANWANLMGDPGMDMWVGIPSTLSAAPVGGSMTLPYGQASVMIQATASGQPAEGAVVCLYQDGNLRSVGLANAAGQAELSLLGHSQGTVKLTVSKADCIPFRGSLNMTTNTLYAALLEAGISGAGMAQPGATLTLNPLAQNTGTQTLNFMSGTLSLDPAYGTVTDASGAWPNITSGSQAEATGSFQIQLNNDLEDGILVPLDFHISAAGGMSIDQVLLVPVNTPALVAVSSAFSPGGSVMPPIGSCDLTLGVGNQGTLSASSLSLTLSTDDPFVTVLDGTHNGYNANVGSSANALFELEVLAGALRGHQATFTMTWNGMGLSGSSDFDLTIASSNEESPTGPDAYGYYAIEDSDYNSNAPAYDWIEIAPAAGGNGTNLYLTDDGNQEDDAATVQLPFDFVYYGIAYDEMAVCSNGFIAFEEGAVNQTDYRNHYLPTGLGPDAMIAPMWDDFVLTGSGDVFWKYDSGLDAVIVEWYAMNHNGSGGTNTFQLLLFNPESYPTSTGDAPFQFQYQDWNNNQSNSYDFPGASVGIKDETSLRGLCLTNYGLDAATSTGFDDQKAILFTTDGGEFDADENDPPHIQVASVGSVQPLETPTIQATVTDPSGIMWVDLIWRHNGGSWTTQAMTNVSGDLFQTILPGYPLGHQVDYYVLAADGAPGANEGNSATLSYTVTSGTPPTGPDGHGYFVYEPADAGEGQGFSWIDISNLGQNLNLSDDASAILDLPFDVPFWGQTFDQISVCSNGFVILGNDGSSPYSNERLLQGNGSSNMICALWDDLNPASGGSVRAWSDVAGGRVVLAWLGVPHYGTSDYETFEIIFYDPTMYPTISGDSAFLVQYQTVANSNSCTIGHQNNGRNDGIQVAYNDSWASDLSEINDNGTLFTTTGTASLQAITDLEANYSTGQVTLSWSTTGAPTYKIYSSDSGYGSFSTYVGSTSGTEWSTAANVETYFQVRSSTSALRQTQREMRVVRVQETPKN